MTKNKENKNQLLNISSQVRYDFISIKKIFKSSDDFYVMLDGFSLLCELFHNKHVNWINYQKNDGNYTEGGCVPFLHCIYGIERYLSMLYKLKKNIKIIFFEPIEQILKENETELYLAYELMIFHLMNMKDVVDVKFYTEKNYLETFSNEIKLGGTLCLILFNHLDMKLKNPTVRARLNFFSEIITKECLFLGLRVVLTKDFWYDIDCISAWSVALKNGCKKSYLELSKQIYLNRNDERKYNLNLKTLSRQDIYFEALRKMKNDPLFIKMIHCLHPNKTDGYKIIENLIILHLYILESLSINERKLEYSMASINNIKNQNPHINNLIDLFIKHLADIFFQLNDKLIENKTPKYLLFNNLDDCILKNICDIFDGRLFFHTLDQLNRNGLEKMLSDLHNLCDNKQLFDQLINQIPYKSSTIVSKESTTRDLNNNLIESKKNCENKLIEINFSSKIDNILFETYLANFKFNEFGKKSKQINGYTISEELKNWWTFFDVKYDEFTAKNFLNSKSSKEDQNLKINQFYKLFKSEKKVDKNPFSDTLFNDLQSNLMDEITQDDSALNHVDQQINLIKHDQFLNAKSKSKKIWEKVKKIEQAAKINDSYIIDDEEIIKIPGLIGSCEIFRYKIYILDIYLELMKHRCLNTIQEYQIQYSIDYYKCAEVSIRALKIILENHNITQFDLKLFIGKISDDLKGILKLLKLDNKDLLEYQLELAQFDLHREHFGKKDKRVKEFIPEAWQISLIDAIDARKSCLVSAPTSSGKTFASLYAIESVLKDKTSTDIVVYVAPTKALLNQMFIACAQNFRDHPNEYLIGMFSRDSRVNLDCCRILLIVPECLEILYFSPEGHSEITRKFKYIIFDEFQSISDEDRGKVWERCILIHECPFLALSATIANPHILIEWLQSCKSLTLRNRVIPLLNFIENEENLISFFEQIDKSETFELTINEKSVLKKALQVSMNLKKKDFAKSFNNKTNNKAQINFEKILLKFNEDPKTIKEKLQFYLNPVVLIEYNLPSTEFVYHLYEKKSAIKQKVLTSVSPLACLNKANKTQTIKERTLTIHNMTLSPSDTLRLYNAMMLQSPSSNISLLKMIEYYSFADKVFITRNDVVHFEKYLKKKLIELNENSIDDYNKLIDYLKKDEFDLGKISEISIDSFDFIKLIEDMQSKEMLPALAFSFDRKECEKLTEKLLKHFQNKCPHIQPVISKDTNNDWKEVNGKNSFVKTNYGISGFGNISDSQLEKILNLSFPNVNDWRREAIKYGFAYHHANLTTIQRAAIEFLFRNRHIQLIFCTTTLAQGVHMPCKSVIFISDSVYLNASIFKQCSGRAGRRGYDKYGNIVLLNLPEVRLKQLITSKSAEISGSFLTSPTFILRIFCLLSTVKSAYPNMITLLNHSLQTFLFEKSTKSEHEKSLNSIMLKFYFLFCSEYLLKNSLIDNQGLPINLSNLTIRLHYHEPGNLVLNYLISTGVMHLVCKKNSSERAKNLLIILCHLFNRVDLFSLVRIEKKLRDKNITIKSQLILDDLDECVLNAIKQHNEIVHDSFYRNMIDLNRSMNSDLELTLPLSKFNFYKNVKPYNKGSIESLILNSISSLETEIVSPFAALSGCNDLDVSFHIKNTSCFAHLKGHLLDFKDLYPTMIVGDELSDFYDNPVKLNSYILDFYNHGDFLAILSENEISYDVAYSNIVDFNMLLRNLYQVCSRFYKYNENKNKNRNKIHEDEFLYAIDELYHTFDDRVSNSKFDSFFCSQNE